ncbi:VirB4 family type IV secretion system protein [Glycomyces salinus]|uniref:VirB4 family type IV secretion system protein n=1 Tax=Glycomyces salinus TaxID=980294 RepID=UPI0018EB98BB|nr:type VI secretion protein [Glycomyces salinus]
MAKRKRTPRAERHLATADIGLGEWADTTAPAKLRKAKPEHKEKRTAEPIPPQRGWARPFAGRAPKLPDVPTHRGSTGQMQGLYPFLYGQALPPLGIYVGVDCLSGGAFSFHPVEWLHRGVTTNPNVLLTGLPGAGKSGTAKLMALRLMASGVKTFVLGDLKNEYAPLARALGVEPVELGPGIRNRLNPLDAGPAGLNLPADSVALRERLDDIHRRRVTLLASLLEVRLGRPLDPTEETAVSLAIRHASGEADAATTLVDPTIPQVWALLRDPTTEMAEDLRYETVPHLREAIRPAADALGIMVRGSLAGLFDGPTTVKPDFDAYIQTVDLSRLDGRGDETVAMTLACVSTWGQAAIDEPDGPVRLVVRDELWRAMRIPAMVKKLDADLRLSRNQGTIQLLSTHRLADFEAVGAADSEEVAIARALIGSCDIRVCLAQDTAPLAMTRDEIGLTDTEAAQIAAFSAQTKGRAVWKIGRSHSHVVQAILSPLEQELTDTNARMTTGGRVKEATVDE